MAIIMPEMMRRNGTKAQRGWSMLWGLLFLCGALIMGGYGLAQYRLGNIRMSDLLGGSTRTPPPAPTATRNLPAVIQEAETQYQKGDYRAAINIYEQVLRRQPNDADIIHKITRMQVYMGQGARAEQRLARALQIDPNSPILHATLCLALNWQSKLSEAMRECDIALRAAPNNPLIVAYTAEAQTDTNDRRQALVNARRALELAPRDPDVLRVMGYYFEQTQRYGEAIDSYGESLSAVPGQPHVLLAIGRSYATQKNIDRAILFYKKATEMDPNYAEAWERYADTAWTGSTKDFNTATNAFEKAQNLDPQRYTVYTKRAIMNTTRLRWDTALDDFQTAITITRQMNKTLSPFDYFYMGYAYEQLRKCSDSRAAYQRAIDGAQGDPTFVSQVQAGLNRCR